MDTKNNEIKPLSYELPYALDITLYKHNYYDNKIITHLKSSTQYETIEGVDDSFIVTVSEFKGVLDEHFNKELNAAHNLTENTLKDGVNSIYFIDKIFSNFNNLEYIRINVSNKRSFTRVVELDQKRNVISFDYKIVTAVLNVTDYTENDSELIAINNLFKDIGLIKEDNFGKKNNYFTVSAQDLMTLINSKHGLSFELEDPDELESEHRDSIELIYDLIDSKHESDNPKIIVITDYL